MGADKSRRSSRLVSILRSRLKTRMHNWIKNGHFYRLSSNGHGRLLIRAENIDSAFVLRVIHRKFDVVLSAAPIGNRALVWTCTMASMTAVSSMSVAVIISGTS